jgi:membrane protein implicated in regulation of membrane protease activity
VTLLLIGLLLAVAVWFGRLLGPALVAMVLVLLLPVWWVGSVVWAFLHDTCRWAYRRCRPGPSTVNATMPGPVAASQQRPGNTGA